MKAPLALAFLLALPSLALEIPPAPTRYATDYSGSLDGAGLARAEAALAALERAHGHQVIAAFFTSLEGEALEDFTMRCAEAWRVGRRGLDDGVIFFAFLADRRMRLEVGYGLEATVTDATARRLLDGAVRPHFAKGDYGGGVAALAEALGQVFSGSPPPTVPPRGRPLLGLALLAVIIVVFLLLLVVADAVGRPPSAWTGRRRSSWGTPMGGFGGGFG